MSELQNTIDTDQNISEDISALAQFKLNHEALNCDACFFAKMCKIRPNQNEENSAEAIGLNQFDNNFFEYQSSIHNRAGELFSQGLAPKEIDNILAGEGYNSLKSSEALSAEASAEADEKTNAGPLLELQQRIKDKFNLPGEELRQLEKQNALLRESFLAGTKEADKTAVKTKTDRFKLAINSRGECDLQSSDGRFLLEGFSDEAAAAVDKSKQTGIISREKYAEYIKQLLTDSVVSIDALNANNEVMFRTVYELRSDGFVYSYIREMENVPKENFAYGSIEKTGLESKDSAQNPDQGSSPLLPQQQAGNNHHIAVGRDASHSEQAHLVNQPAIKTNDSLSIDKKFGSSGIENSAVDDAVRQRKAVAASDHITSILRANEASERKEQTAVAEQTDIGIRMFLETNAQHFEFDAGISANEPAMIELPTDFAVDITENTAARGIKNTGQIKTNQTPKNAEAGRKTEAQKDNAENAFEMFGIILDNSINQAEQAPAKDGAEQSNAISTTSATQSARPKAIETLHTSHHDLKESNSLVVGSENPIIPDGLPRFEIDAKTGEITIGTSEGISLPFNSNLERAALTPDINVTREKNQAQADYRTLETMLPAQLKETAAAEVGSEQTVQNVVVDQVQSITEITTPADLRARTLASEKTENTDTTVRNIAQKIDSKKTEKIKDRSLAKTAINFKAPQKFQGISQIVREGRESHGAHGLELVRTQSAKEDVKPSPDQTPADKKIVAAQKPKTSSVENTAYKASEQAKSNVARQQKSSEAAKQTKKILEANSANPAKTSLTELAKLKTDLNKKVTGAIEAAQMLFELDSKRAAINSYETANELPLAKELLAAAVNSPAAADSAEEANDLIRLRPQTYLNRTVQAA